MFGTGQGPSSSDLKNAEYSARERYESLENNAARRAQFGIQRPKLRESMRRWYYRLTRRKPAEH